MNELFCLMLSKGTLTPILRGALFETAQHMMREGVREHRMIGDFSGIITTEGRSATVGHYCGQEFHAQAVSASGEVDVTFIVRKCDAPMSEGSWRRATVLDPSTITSEDVHSAAIVFLG
jgi:hypothetical protein